MKANLKFALLAMFLVMMKSTYASKVVAPPSVGELAGPWFGCESSGLYFYRLDLKSDGTGLFASGFLNESPHLYVIKHWSLARFDIKIDCEATDPHDFAITLNGVVADSETIRLDVAGVGFTWRYHAALHNEKQFLAKYEISKAAMEAFKPKVADVTTKDRNPK